MRKEITSLMLSEWVSDRVLKGMRRGVPPILDL